MGSETAAGVMRRAAKQEAQCGAYLHVDVYIDRVRRDIYGAWGIDHTGQRCGDGRRVEPSRSEQPVNVSDYLLDALGRVRIMQACCSIF